MNEQCDTETHKCVKKLLNLSVPESIVAGEQFTVRLLDNNMNPVPGAKIRIEYKSGISESFTTDEQGAVSLVAKESGPVTIKADVIGYDRKVVIANVTPGFDPTAIVLLVIILGGAGTGFFYWKQMPPVALKKEIQGQSVVLKVKNRSGEYMENVVISDTVPKGAFISCGLMPRIEDMGSETALTWFAALNDEEEIVINYQAAQTSDSFLVRIGNDEYQSGHGVMGIFKDIINSVTEKVHLGKSEVPPA